MSCTIENAASVATRRIPAVAAGVAAAGLLTMALAACGQKGPLMLPKAAHASASASAASAP